MDGNQPPFCIFQTLDELRKLAQQRPMYPRKRIYAATMVKRCERQEPEKFLTMRLSYSVLNDLSGSRTFWMSLRHVSSFISA